MCEMLVFVYILFNTNKFRSLESRDSKKNHNAHKNCLKSREHYSGKWGDNKDSLLKIIALAQNKEIISLKHIEGNHIKLIKTVVENEYVYKEPNSLEIAPNVSNQNELAQIQTHNKVNQNERIKREEKSEIRDDKEIEKVQILKGKEKHKLSRKRIRIRR